MLAIASPVVFCCSNIINVFQHFKNCHVSLFHNFVIINLGTLSPAFYVVQVMLQLDCTCHICR